MPAIFEYRVLVSSDDIDALGHANNVTYLAWTQAAALAHSEAQGWPLERYRQLGLGWVARSHEIKYLAPAFLGDVLLVRTWVAEFRKVSSLRRYKILRPADGVLVASATTEWAFVDFAKGTIQRVPPEVVAAFDVLNESG